MMNRSEIAKCPRCGAQVPADAPEGLCPRCVGALNLDPETTIAGQETSREPAPAPSQLGPKFPELEILEFIGKGGMGAVYKARQKELDRLVALKILPPRVGADATFAERFGGEAKALARLNHPGIVTLYEFGRTPDGLYYFLMEFVDGVNLRQLLHAGRVSAREALTIVPQVCDALQYAHDHGIIHRDIKPENILLDRKGRVKIADFGLAKLVSHPDQPGTPGEDQGPRPASSITQGARVIGTPKYMAPEQAERPGEVDHRADIYALGVVLYQMLTGELPNQRLEPPSRKVEVDVRLDEVVLRSLEREPARRYQQASEIKTAVESILQTAPPQAKAPAPIRPSRHRLLIAAFIILAVCLVGFLGLWRMRRESPSERLSQSVVEQLLDSNLVTQVELRYSTADPLLTEVFGRYWKLTGDGKLLTSFRSTVRLTPTLEKKLLDLPQTKVREDTGSRLLSLFRIAHKGETRSAALSSISFHCQVLEVDAGVVDKLIPASRRKPGIQPGASFYSKDDTTQGGRTTTTGTFSVTKRGSALTESVVAPIDDSILLALLNAMHPIPGLLADQRKTVSGIWWRKGVGDVWAYSINRQDQNLWGDSSGNVVLGFHRKGDATEIHIDGILRHSIDLIKRVPEDVLASRILYEGAAPEKGALVFLVPFLRSDGSAHYLVVSYQIGGPAVTFGPIIERVINCDMSGTNAGIDLDSGRLVNLPFFSMARAGTNVVGSKSGQEFLIENGVDAIGAGTTGSPSLNLLTCVNDTFAMTTDETSWDTADAEWVRVRAFNLKPLQPDNPVGQMRVALGSEDGKFPKTFIFQTRARGTGLLQIVEPTDAPIGLRIRYKLVIPTAN